MCDPLTIGGLALSGISAAANAAAQSRVADARDDALAAERIRQGTLDKEAAALNTRSQDRYQDFEGQQEARATTLADYFTGQDVPEPAAAEAVPQSSSNITVREEAKQRGQAKEMTDRTGTALGNLRAFGDLLSDTSRLQGRDASLIGQIGGFKRGSSNIVPLELDQASRAGQGLGMVADIAGGLGSIGVNAGLSGSSIGSMFGGGVDPRAGMRTVGSTVPKRGLFQLYG